MKVYSKNSRGPLRGVVRVDELVRRHGYFNYIVRLSCGHSLYRQLWRETETTHCCACLGEARKKEIEA